MGIITEVAAQKKNAARVNIFVDGEFAVGLEAITAASYGLKAGREIGKEELDRIALESDGEAAFRRALEYIGRRMRTTAEIRTYLAGKGYAGPVIDAVAAKLSDYGFLDDGAFVKAYLETYGGRRGKKRLRQDLLRMGAAADLVETSMTELGDQREAVRAAAEKYLRMHPFDRRKLSSHLASKGFEWEEISSVVRALGGREEDE